MEHLFTTDSIISFFILVILEIVLGIDNVIFVSIIMNRLPSQKMMAKARRFWMISGIIMRSLLLMALGWFGYRAIVEWRNSSILVAERRTSEAADLLLEALINLLGKGVLLALAMLVHGGDHQ